MKGLGLLHHFHHSRLNYWCYLHWPVDTEKIMHLFGMLNSKPVGVPGNPVIKLVSGDNPDDV